MFLLLADLVVVLHLAFIAFVVAGGLLLVRRPRAIWLHLPAAAWGAAIEFGGWICPLTPLENRLRAMAGADAYAGDFVARHLLPLIYPEALTRDVQILLGVGVVAVNLAIYGRWLRRRASVK
jgi:hypothetical protein